MENTPGTLETLREHFSRRASAARMAIQKLVRPAPPKPSPDAPMVGPPEHREP
jgi:hypothetical protein